MIVLDDSSDDGDSDDDINRSVSMAGGEGGIVPTGGRGEKEEDSSSASSDEGGALWEEAFCKRRNPNLGHGGSNNMGRASAGRGGGTTAGSARGGGRGGTTERRGGSTGGSLRGGGRGGGMGGRGEWIQSHNTLSSSQIIENSRIAHESLGLPFDPSTVRAAKRANHMGTVAPLSSAPREGGHEVEGYGVGETEVDNTRRGHGELGDSMSGELGDNTLGGLGVKVCVHHVLYLSYNFQ